jgi:hypothetical protein
MSLLKIEYCSWRKTVGAFLAALTGGSLQEFDIEGYPFRKDFDDGKTPRTSAETAIKFLKGEQNAAVS